MEEKKSKTINLEDRTEVDPKQIVKDETLEGKEWQPHESEPFSVKKDKIEEDKNSGGM